MPPISIAQYTYYTGGNVVSDPKRTVRASIRQKDEKKREYGCYQERRTMLICTLIGNVPLSKCPNAADNMHILSLYTLK